MVKVTPFYGIIVKLASLDRIGLSISEFCNKTQATFLASDLSIASFGPCFGKEAGDEIARQIDLLGLEYVSDYFTLDFDVPEWLQLYVEANSVG